jgi:hypothetical protein
MITATVPTNRAQLQRLSACETGSGRLEEHAQKAKMLETQGMTNTSVTPKPTTNFRRVLLELPRTETRVRNAQTLKPRARSWSRPSSVIISMPHGGIHTQLITHRSTSPSSAVWV